MTLTVERKNVYGIGIGKRFPLPQATTDHRAKVDHNTRVLTDQSFVESMGKSCPPQLFNLISVQDGLIISCGESVWNTPSDSILLIGNCGNPGDTFTPVTNLKGDGSIPKSVTEALRQVPVERYEAN